jgi:hypothetical protein
MKVTSINRHSIQKQEVNIIRLSLRKFALDESKSEFLHLGKSALERIANRCVNGFIE